MGAVREYAGEANARWCWSDKRSLVGFPVLCIQEKHWLTQLESRTMIRDLSDGKFFLDRCIDPHPSLHLVLQLSDSQILPTIIDDQLKMINSWHRRSKEYFSYGKPKLLDVHTKSFFP